MTRSSSVQNPRRPKTLFRGVYGVAFLLVVIPIVDSVSGVLPLRIGQVAWRFGTFGLLSRAIMTPLLGMMLAMVTAALLDHRRALRALSVVGFVCAAASTIAIPLFILDALQMRAHVKPEATSAFDMVSAIALAKYALGGAIFGCLGMGSWKASRRRRQTADATDEAGSRGTPQTLWPSASAGE